MQDIVKTEHMGAVLSIRLSNPETRNSLTDDLRKQVGIVVGRGTNVLFRRRSEHAQGCMRSVAGTSPLSRAE